MFKFKGISSEEMQVVIEEEEHFIAKAAQRYEVTEIEGRDDAIFDTQGYSYVERPILVQCLNINKIDDILAWLNGEGEFEYKGRKTVARFYSELEPRRESCIRIIDATFIRAPFWTKTNDDFILVKDRKDKETISSSNITINDSAEARFKKLVVKGNSWQETDDTKPSPEFESPIRNCGDNVNLINKLESGYYNQTTKEIESQSSQIYKSFAIDIDKGMYILSCNNQIHLLRGFTDYDNSNTVIFSGTKENISSFTIEITQKTKLYISVRRADNENWTEADLLKLEQGTKATPYSPYNCGNVNFKICNKNLLNISNKIITLIKNSQRTQNIYPITPLIFKPGTYTISLPDLQLKNNIYNLQCGIFCLDKNGYNNNIQTVTFNNSKKNFTFTVQENLKLNYIYVYLVSNDNDNATATFEFIQIEEGDRGTDFIEHQEQLFSFPTKEGQVLHKGDYLADDGVHQKMIEIILDGEKNKVERITTSTTDKYRWKFYTKEKIDNCDSQNSIAYSNKLKLLAPRQTVYAQDGFTTTSDGNIMFFIDKYSTKTNEEMNQLLKEDNIKFLISLAEEIIEPYSPEQEEVWDQIKNAKTYKGTTYIFSEDEISPEFEAIYFTETNEKIINEGNIESRPIIRLEKTVSNEVEITINNIRFKYDFKNDSYVEIDCQEKTVKYEGLNRNRQIKIGYDFPELKIKDNNIIMHEGDCLIKVKRKDRWL